MEYISMERAVGLAVQANILMEEKYADGGNKLSWASDENFQALCKAAIADYLKGVREGVELPEIDHRRWTEDEIAFTKKYTRQAIATYAARLKQAEDVLRMARKDIEVLSRLANTDHTGPRASVAAINQQLGEK